MADRNVLLVAHTGRDQAIAACLETLEQLVSAGLVPVMTTEQLGELNDNLSSNSESLALLNNVRELGIQVAEEQLEL